MLGQSSTDAGIRDNDVETRGCPVENRFEGGQLRVPRCDVCENELDSSQVQLYQQLSSLESKSINQTYLYPSLINSPSTFFPGASLQSQIATHAPASASALTIPRPIPEAPPVTIATLSLKTLRSNGLEKSMLFVPSSEVCPSGASGGTDISAKRAWERLWSR